MAPKKKEVPQESLKGAEAEKRILEYLQEQNRPHGVADITANLKVIKKADVAKALTALEESNKIFSKLFAKQAVYCVNQADSTTASPEELEALSVQLRETREASARAREKVKAQQAILHALNAAPRDSELGAALCSLDQNVAALTAQLEAVQGKGAGAADTAAAAGLTEEALDLLAAAHRKAKALWASRRKTCKEIIGALADGMEDADVKAGFAEHLGIEEDPPELQELERQEKEASRSRPGGPRGTKRLLNGKHK